MDRRVGGELVPGLHNDEAGPPGQEIPLALAVVSLNDRAAKRGDNFVIMTDTYDTFTAGGTPDPDDGWWDRLARLTGPAFYATSWAPWLRIVITAVLVFAAVVYLRS